MPKTPRGKRVVDPTTDSFRVVNKAPNGEAQPYFDKSRNVWVAVASPTARSANRPARPEHSQPLHVIATSPRPSGESLDLVFTTAAGTPMLRQHVEGAIRVGATKAGIDPTGLGSHAGRRSVVTSLFASGSLDFDDVARFVGHTETSTTRGYVQHEGDRPRQISERAFELLDPNWTADESS